MGKFCPLCKRVDGVSTTIDVPAIHRSFRNGQMVGNQINLVMVMHKEAAMDQAPYRTGRLKREHFSQTEPVIQGPRRAYTVGTHVPYAIMLFGTAGKGSGYITPKRGDQLELRPLPYSWFLAGDSERFREKVRGQKPHEKRNWLKHALLIVLAKRGVLTIDAAIAMMDDADLKNA